MNSGTDNKSPDNGKTGSTLCLNCPPPETDQWIEILHWCLMVLGPRHRDSAITAGLLSYAHEYGGLTERQARTASLISDRLAAEYRVQHNG